MSNVTIEHLGREACVYVPAWSPAQRENHSLDHTLRERARTLGWQKPVVIDDDWGHLPFQSMARAGFDHLLASVCRGEVGAVLVAEASCLARTSRRWNVLLEFCALADTLIIDGAAIYSPRTAEDRLLLGMKGLLTDLGIAPFRAQTARPDVAPGVARSGMVTIGYLSRLHEGPLGENTDAHVKEMVELYFRRFCA
jgi:hypothetical protein